MSQHQGLAAASWAAGTEHGQGTGGEGYPHPLSSGYFQDNCFQFGTFQYNKDINKPEQGQGLSAGQVGAGAPAVGGGGRDGWGASKQPVRTYR